MRRTMVAMVLALGAAAWAPQSASASGLDLRVGAFAPRAHSTLFTDDADLYGTRPKDFVGAMGGAEYSFGLGDRLEIGVHVDGYGHSVQSSYRDFTDPGDREITQTLKTAIVPIGVSFRLLLTDRGSRVVPYVAAGPDAIYWRYEEEGDFIDFEDSTLPIIPDHFLSEGVTAGAHVAAGARFNVSHDVAVTGEARYLWGGADMGRDFRGSRIDVSGLGVTVGVHLRF